MGRPRSAARKNWPEGVYQNTAGYFYWLDPSTKKTHGLGYDKATAFAEARAANAMRTAEASKSLLQKIKDDETPTLKAWTDTWLAKAALRVKPKTIKNHQACLRELVARCGHISVREITAKHVAEVLTKYTEEGKPRMAELIRDTLKEIFRQAEELGHIDLGKSPITPTRVKKAKVTRMRLTLEDFLKIHAAQHKPWAKRSMELALLSTQRRQDIAAMKRADIVDGHLQVDQGKGGGKTKLGIPLSLTLDAVGWSLKDVIERCRTPGLISPYMVHHRTKGGQWVAGAPVAVDTISEAFAEARSAAGIEAPPGRTPVTFHEIRSLAIRLFKDQYGREFTQALAGHKNMRTTLLYADPRNSEALRIMIPDPGQREFLTNIE